MAQALNTTYTGIPSVDQITAEQRIYGRTEDILKIPLGRIHLMRIIYDNFSKSGKIPVTDMEFKYKSEVPRPFVLLAAANSGDATTLWIEDKWAPMIEPGASLVARNMFLKNASGTLTWGASMGASTGCYENEVIFVVAKGESDGTNTPFTITRAICPSCGGTGGSPTHITEGMGFAIMPKTQAIGSNEGAMYGDTANEETNYCGIILEKWGQPKTAMNIKTWQSETNMERNGRRQLELFWKKKEWELLFQKKNTGLDVQGRRWYTSGGIDQYILTAQSAFGYEPGDGTAVTDHVIDFNATYGDVNYQNLNKFGNNKFFYGSDVKWWIMDNEQYTKVANSFDNKIRIVKNNELSMRYGFKVEDLDISGGGTFHIVQSDAFSIGGFQNMSYIIDFRYFQHAHLQNEDFTILTDVEKGMNPFIKVNYLYMNSGVKCVNPFAHFKVVNM